MFISGCLLMCRSCVRGSKLLVRLANNFIPHAGGGGDQLVQLAETNQETTTAETESHAHEDEAETQQTVPRIHALAVADGRS